MAKRKRKSAKRATKSTLASIPRDNKGRFAGEWLVLKTCNGPVCKSDGGTKKRLTARDKDRLDDYNRVLSELEALAEASSTGNDEWQDFAEFVAFQRQSLKDGVKDQYELNDDEKAAFADELAKQAKKADDTRVFVSNVDWSALDPGNMDPADVRQINRLLGKGFVKRVKTGLKRGRKYVYETSTKNPRKKVPLDHPALVRVGWDDIIREQIADGNSGIEVSRE